MNKALIFGFAVALGLLPALGAAQAMEEEKTIYGSQLMTQEERDEYRARMRAATTPEEKAQIREEHHARMKARGEEMGVELPDEPPARGERMGPGGGMGPGDGTGPGYGR
ncbi:hypothetical protein ECTPHS_07217 [Ectothiorhodospira sp. PHS-1]|uniref:hypothetical protein n=1 Tax=Ectothiorhodospira sp. PHS-1 TaxID=519989 RepID=UPI00024A8916|nr:hypothetical protein [Ectothiorhodospira sp. PHS-1]EHQ52463.1 hypothetical protein ECTPHS_07217 [Ectothiorhodospira sp. PHS-1]